MFFFVLIFFSDLALARIPFNFLPIQGSDSFAPTALTLTQTTRNRTFTVSWTSGSGNGGAGGCKLQYQKDGTTWTDLAGTYNCDSNTAGAAAAFPTTNNWTNNFNATGVTVRLLRSSDSVVMGTFTQRGVCSSTSHSTTSTPNIDEDCNGIWDNTSVGGCYSGSPSSLTIGSAYSCPATTTCDGTTATFSSAQFGMNGVPSYTNSSCTIYKPPYTLVAMFLPSSGTVPSDANGVDMTSTACQPYLGSWVKLNTALTTWPSGDCYYEYNVYY